MKIIEQTHSTLAIQFGDPFTPIATFLAGLIVGIAIAAAGAATDQVLIVILGALVVIVAAFPLTRESHALVTLDRDQETVAIRKVRTLVPNLTEFRLENVRGFDGLCGTVRLTENPNAARRCDFLVDLRAGPDYVIRRNVKVQDINQAVGLIYSFLGWL